MLSFLRRIIRAIEQTPVSLPLWCTAFLALILVRIGIESSLGFFEPRSLSFLFFEFSHTFLFFLTAFFCLLPVLRFAGARTLESASNLLLFGFLIILSPPIIDTLIFGNGGFWSFYKFDSIRGLITRFFTLFGDAPDIGITYGVRIEVVLVTLGIGLYSFLVSRQWRRTLLATFFTYTILFLLGTFPSYLTFLTEGYTKSPLALDASDIARLFLTPSDVFSRSTSDIRDALNMKMSLWYACLLVFLIGHFVYTSFRSVFFALLRNARLPQLLYHGGLLCLGMLLAYHFTKPVLLPDQFHVIAFFLLIASIECAWLASVIVNDCFDTRIDAATNISRPLITQSIDISMYRTIGSLFFLTSILFSALVSFSAALLLVLYQAIAWMYSAPPFRLKRVPGIATLAAAAAALLILLLGFIVMAPTRTFSLLPLSLLFFLFIAYAVALPLKDFKDIRGDQSDGVLTFPVLLGAERAKLVFGSIFFLLFIASVYVTHIRSAFLPALVFGSASFFLMQTTTEHHPWRHYRNLPLLMLGLITLYGLIVLWLTL